jgi:hypothetical protein
VADDPTPVSEQPEHPASLSDDELVERLNDHRRGSGEWAAVLGELQRRADRQHVDDRFRALLAEAEDRLEPPAEDGVASSP